MEIEELIHNDLASLMKENSETGMKKHFWGYFGCSNKSCIGKE